MTSRFRNRFWPLILALALAFIAIPAGVVSAQDLATGEHTAKLILTGLSLPTDAVVGPDGMFYVVDSGNHQVVVFNTKGERVAVIGSRGSDRGQFESPVGIGAGSQGEIYVADKGNSRLQVIGSDGQLRRPISLEEDGETISPVDVAVSIDGRELYVSSNNTHRILVYSNEGEFLRAWGGEGDEPGQFRYPATVAVDREGNILAVDVLHAQVQKFDESGELLAVIGKRGGKPGTFFRPKGIALDTRGHIYVSDSYLGVIQVLNGEGEFLFALGSAGVATVFETPVGISVVDDRLLLTEMLPGRVTVLEVQAPPTEVEAAEQ